MALVRVGTVTERDVQVAAVAWAAGVLATTALVLVSYLLWWRAERPVSTAQASTSAQFHAGRPPTSHRGDGNPRSRARH